MSKGFLSGKETESEIHILYLDALDKFLGLGVISAFKIDLNAWNQIYALKDYHSEACWVISILPCEPLSESEVVNSFYAKVKWPLDNHDSARALCYGAVASLRCGHFLSKKLLEHFELSANFGNALAQYEFTRSMIMMDNEARISWIAKSALQNNRQALFEQYQNFGLHHKQNLKLALISLKKAADLGHPLAMSSYACRLSVITYRYRKSNDPEIIYWHGKAALKGCDLGKLAIISWMKKNPIEDAVQLDTNWWGEAVFMLGQVLKDCLDKKFVYGIDFTDNDHFPFTLSEATLAVNRYDQRCNQVRQSIYSWLIIARRLGYHFVNKDITLFIARLVWNGRGLN